MKFRDRIKRLEEKFCAAGKSDGEKLRPPILVSQYVRVGARDETGCPIGEPVTCDSRTAEVTVCNGPSTNFVRNEAETLANFEQRCCDSLRGVGGAIRMNGDGGEGDNRAIP